MQGSWHLDGFKPSNRDLLLVDTLRGGAYIAFERPRQIRRLSDCDKNLPVQR